MNNLKVASIRILCYAFIKNLEVASQLEDSLTVAASALALVKSVEPNIITIQV